MLRSCLVVVALACDDYTQCPVVDSDVLADALPARISETGFSEGRAYTPAFELWSDGATELVDDAGVAALRALIESL